MSDNKETNELPVEKKYYKHVVIFSLVVAVFVAFLPLMGSVGVANPKTAGTGGLWMNFLAHFHPLMLHLPIGALVLVICMEILNLITRGKYQPQTTLALAFAAGTAVLAVVFGYFWYLTGGYNEADIAEHKRDGVIFTVLMIITFLIKYTADIKDLKLLKVGYLPFLLITGGIMMSAGHHGGEISHGDPLNHLPSKILAKREADNNKPVVTDPVIYANIVHPILENKCISCHGEEKQKGDLRMDSLAHMLDGGADEECLVPEKPEDSFMLLSLDLPEDDDYHMPPKAKPQITPEEKKILTWWVKMGAPEKTKLSEVEVPTEITAAIATLKTPEQLAAEEEAKRLAKEKLAQEKAATRERLKGAWTTVNKQFPGSLRYQSQEDTLLSFSTVSYRKTFKESDLDILKDIAADVVDLDLSSTVLTDAGIEKLKGFSKLKKLKLNDTKITDNALKVIAELKSLEKLNLYGTAVSDAGIKVLASHPTLEKVYLWNTKVTEAGAKDLEANLLKQATAEKDDKGQLKRKPKVHLGIKTSSPQSKPKKP